MLIIIPEAHKTFEYHPDCKLIQEDFLKDVPTKMTIKDEWLLPG